MRQTDWKDTQCHSGTALDLKSRELSQTCSSYHTMEKQRKDKATCLLFLPHPPRIISGFLSYSNSSIAHTSRCALNMGSHAAGHVLAYITQPEASNFPNSIVLSSHSQEKQDCPEAVH